MEFSARLQRYQEKIKQENSCSAYIFQFAKWHGDKKSFRNNHEKQKYLKNKTLKVSILKYNGGNVQSVIFALNRLGIEPILTDDIEEIKTIVKGNNLLDLINKKGTRYI